MARTTVLPETAELVARLADAIGDRQPPGDTRTARGIRTRTARQAAAKGWKTLAWGPDEEIAELEANVRDIRKELKLEHALEVHRLHYEARLTLDQLAERYDVAQRQVSRWVDTAKAHIAAEQEAAATASQVDGEALTA